MRDATLAFLAGHRSERTEAIAGRLVEVIEESNPGYRHTGLVPHGDLWRSCRANVDRVLELLAVSLGASGPGTRPERDPAYDAARETGRRRAEQGLPLDDVLRSFRIGGRLIWDDLVEAGGDALDAAEVREIGTRLWEVVDETSAQVAAAYHLHERALVREDERQRAELWEGLLGGRAREAWFAQEAGRLLDLPPSVPVVVVVAASLEVRRADVRLAPHATAWVRRAGETVGIVALRQSGGAGALAVARALDDVGRREGQPVGLSGPQSSLAGTDDGYREAALALRAQGSTAGVASFDDRLPEALLLRSPDVADRLVTTWLEPVLSLAPAEARVLLDTLSAWVRCGGSATRTAAAAHCHRNTVLNRLRRVEQVTGRALGDEAVPAELDLALRAWRMQ